MRESERGESYYIEFTCHTLIQLHLYKQPGGKDDADNSTDTPKEN